MNEEITKLIDLQAIDSEIDGFDQEIHAMEQEITALEQSIADKENKISLCREESEQLERQQRELKTGMEESFARIKDRQNKMMQVQTSREHQALLKEIEENKKMIKTQEDRILQLIEQVEQLGQDAAELEGLIAEEKELLLGKKEEVKKAVNKINSRKTVVMGKREALAPALQPNTLQRYTMLRERRNGTAVVPTRNGVCQGCFMTIPPQQENEVRKGEKLNFCPTCQRILYYLEEEEAESLDA
ncbi:MAG: C4-type zinc ribbon domain-containing protein [Desulfobulbaceae bacterium]|nr:C4-type zinc ribbon domain-containing protein [Desulfobulbaceae bacterium]MDY0350350.1 C4-type zinc ribbon domain-containing protein [Desulfobulbaceae bacterium]